MKISRKYISFFEELSYAFLITVLFIFLKGYAFNIGDHADHLVPVYEKMHPGLYKGDFFMDYQTQTFNIRYYYIQLLYILSFIGPVSFWCFFLTLACIMASVYSWMQIAYILTQNRAMKFAAPAGIFLIFYGFTLGSNNIIYSQFIGSTIAKAFIPAGLLFYLNKKCLFSAIALGLATIFHAVAGLQPFMILAALSVIGYKKMGVKQIFIFIFGYLIVAAIVLYPNIKIQFLTRVAYDKDLYNQIFYYFRNPHHYLPGVFKLKYWIKYSLIFGLYLFILMRSRSIEKKDWLLKFTCIQVLGIIVYTVLIEVFDVYYFASIQWYKTTIWIEAFAAILILDYLIKYLKTDYSNVLLNIVSKPAFTISTGAVLLFFITNSVYLPFEKYTNYFQVGNYIKSELTILHEWIRDNTPEQSLFVAPPTDTGFGCESKRPAIISGKAMVHEPKYILEWYERFQKIYHTDLTNLDGTSFGQTAEERYQKGDFDAAFYHAAYGLLAKPVIGKDSVLFETTHYAVVKFRNAN